MREAAQSFKNDTVRRKQDNEKNISAQEASEKEGSRFYEENGYC